MSRLGIRSVSATSGLPWLHHAPTLLPSITVFTNAQSWANVVVTSPPNMHCEPLPALTNHGPHCAACGCKWRIMPGSSTLDLCSVLGHMMESLRSDLQKFFVSQLEEVVRHLRSRSGQSFWPLFPSSVFFNSNTLVCLDAYPGFHDSW